MGNVIGSFFSGLGGVVNKLLGSPLDFLSGKSCSSLCGPTWDLFCYIDNFCVSHLLKLATVSLLAYFVLLFFYLIYQLGICQCICHTLCRVTWACFAIFFSIVEYICTFLCYNLPRLKRTHRRHKRDIEDYSFSSTDEEDFDDEKIIRDHKRYSSHLRRKNLNKRSATCSRRNNRGDRVRKSLRPNSHRVRVGIREDSVPFKKRNSIRRGHNEGSLAHGIRVTRTTQFAQKGGSYRNSANKRRKI